MNQQTETYRAATRRAGLFEGPFCPLDSPSDATMMIRRHARLPSRAHRVGGQSGSYVTANHEPAYA